MSDVFPFASMEPQLWFGLLGAWLFWNLPVSWLFYLMFAGGSGMPHSHAIRWGHTIGCLLFLVWALLKPWPFGGLTRYVLFWSWGAALNVGALCDFGVIFGVSMLWLIFGVWLVGNPER